MKKKLENALTILVVIGILLYPLITAVLDLANNKDLHTVRLNEAFGVLEMEHSINGLIPLGKEYFYLGYEDETNNAYIIKASKHWMDKNFDDDYRALDQNGIEITALAKRMDFDTMRELDARLGKVGGLNYPVGADYCLVANYKKNAIVKLIDFALILCVLITGIYIHSSKHSIKPVFGIVWIAGLLVSLTLYLRMLV